LVQTGLSLTRKMTMVLRLVIMAMATRCRSCAHSTRMIGRYR
jgi:hypothetical protein